MRGYGGKWCDQVFYSNKSLFGNVCGMEKYPLPWVDISTCLDKNSHEGYSAYGIAFGTTPDIVLFLHYTLWDPIYYYDVKDNHPNTKEHLAVDSDSISSNLPRNS